MLKSKRHFWDSHGVTLKRLLTPAPIETREYQNSCNRKSRCISAWVQSTPSSSPFWIAHFWRLSDGFYKPPLLRASTATSLYSTKVSQSLCLSGIHDAFALFTSQPASTQRAREGGWERGIYVYIHIYIHIYIHTCRRPVHLWPPKTIYVFAYNLSWWAGLCFLAGSREHPKAWDTAGEVLVLGQREKNKKMRTYLYGSKKWGQADHDSSSSLLTLNSTVHGSFAFLLCYLLMNEC